MKIIQRADIILSFFFNQIHILESHGILFQNNYLHCLHIKNIMLSYAEHIQTTLNTKILCIIQSGSAAFNEYFSTD